MTKPYSRTRGQEVLNLYQSGLSIQQIADATGATFHAIRMCLQRADGFNEAKARRKYGCTHEQYMTLRGDVALKYCKHRDRAKQRGIGFELGLWEWWIIWKESGHWEERGIRSGEYVMCRKGDAGPYAIGNVFIDLGMENNSKTARKKSNLPRGVSKKEKAKSFTVARQINGEQFSIGKFRTADEAHSAYLSIGK